MKLTLGISTCPNDTFMFDALVNGKVNSRGLEFDLILRDVEELNKLAIEQKLDVTKLSIFNFLNVCNNYKLLNSGNALGKNNGPLLVSKHKIYPDEVDGLKIAIPGLHTTANLLLSIAYPEAKNKKEYLFSVIEEVVLSNEADAGLLIHEGRFTYESKGLKKILDLGEYWEEKSGLPLPLGGIAIRNDIPEKIAKDFENALHDSITYAFDHPRSGYDFIKKYAAELSDQVIFKHIELYVNEYSLELGTTGKKAIETLTDKAVELNLANKPTKEIFL